MNGLLPASFRVYPGKDDIVRSVQYKPNAVDTIDPSSSFDVYRFSSTQSVLTLTHHVPRRERRHRLPTRHPQIRHSWKRRRVRSNNEPQGFMGGG